LENRYKVKLSQNWEAFIPKRFVRSSTHAADTLRESTLLSASWHLSANDRSDVLTVSLPERLPYRSFQSPAPNKIVVDVFGVSTNTTWITQLTQTRIVKNVYREQVEKDVLRIHIELEGQQKGGYSIAYAKNSLRTAEYPAPAKEGGKHLIIAMDPGHGGSAKGAVSPTGTEEKTYYLKCAKVLEAYLHRRGVKNVSLTRMEEVYVARTDR